jgi:SpoVK/Ycf46/Vps4 family AAA+-type ATPase
VFFVDLPLDDERLDIFRVHLRRRGVDHSGFNLDPLEKMTRGWTGAEIEQCVVSALTTARLEDRAVTASTSTTRPAPSSRSRRR